MLEKRRSVWFRQRTWNSLWEWRERWGRNFLRLAKGLRERTGAWSQGELRRTGFENGPSLSLVVWSWESNLVLVALSSFINEERRFDLMICSILSCTNLSWLFQHPKLGHTLHHCSYGSIRIKPRIVSPPYLPPRKLYSSISIFMLPLELFDSYLPLLFIIYKVLFSRTILVFKLLCFPENVLFRYCHHQNYRIIEYYSVRGL